MRRKQSQAMTPYQTPNAQTFTHPCTGDGVLWQRERWGRCAGHSGHGGRGRGAMEPRHHVREVTSGE